jgi:hypothetical protein
MTNPLYCEHKVNRTTCLVCWRSTPAKPKSKEETRTMPEPPRMRSGTTPPEAYNPTEVWQPPARPQLINRLPRRS